MSRGDGSAAPLVIGLVSAVLALCGTTWIATNWGWTWAVALWVVYITANVVTQRLAFRSKREVWPRPGDTGLCPNGHAMRYSGVAWHHDDESQIIGGACLRNSLDFDVRPRETP